MLLCSDGLSNEVGTEEMAAILRTVEDPEEAARRLVEVANEHGGADNITVVIVDVQVGEDGVDGPAEVRPLGLGRRRGRCGPHAAATAAVGDRQPAASEAASEAAPGEPGRRAPGSTSRRDGAVVPPGRTTPWRRAPGWASATSR